MYAENTGVVSSCTAIDCGGDGFSLNAATVQACTARGNAGRGFFSGNGGVISACVARSNTGAGFEVVGGIATGCSSTGNLYGFEINGASVIDCRVGGNNSGGIRASSACQVRGNNVDSPAAFANILVTGVRNRIEGNQTSNGSAGVQVSSGGADNLITGNVFSQAAMPVNASLSLNKVGPVVTAQGTITSTNPFANFAN